LNVAPVQQNVLSPDETRLPLRCNVAPYGEDVLESLHSVSAIRHDGANGHRIGQDGRHNVQRIRHDVQEERYARPSGP
jgi:hypothetical protein